MMFLNSLTDWLRKRIPAEKSPQRPSARLRLEQLEDRVVPANVSTATYTNATVQITPGFTVTETVTATVTPFQSFNFGTGQIVAVPAGATNPTTGTVLFNLNNLTKAATLNSSGQATATFQVPLLSFLTSQTLEVQFLGTSNTATNDFWFSSTFIAPLYKNFDNLLLPGMLSFTQLTPQQVYAQQISSFQNPITPFPFSNPNTPAPFYTAQGEADSIGNGLITFNYVDPGTINTISALGMQLPGIFALQLGAFNGFNVSSSSSSSK